MGAEHKLGGRKKTYNGACIICEKPRGSSKGVSIHSELCHECRATQLQRRDREDSASDRVFLVRPHECRTCGLRWREAETAEWCCDGGVDYWPPEIWHDAIEYAVHPEHDDSTRTVWDDLSLSPFGTAGKLFREMYSRRPKKGGHE